MSLGFRIALVILGLATLGVVFTTFTVPPVTSVQRGYRGVGMVEVYNPRLVAAGFDLNRIPAPEPATDLAGQPSSEAYENVQVLKNVDASEFLRLMQAITNWVSPVQGCTYCHAEGASLADDSLYTKVVARRMLQMTQNLNANWKTHLQNTGVTCYTCHRGMPVPANIWFNAPGPEHTGGMAESNTGKNLASPSVGLASLPYDPFTLFLEQANEIRVNSTTALPTGDRQSIKQTEWTYGLMMHFSTSMGVNCTYCHNSRQFASWEQSTPQRITAWYGIRMVRDVNNVYLDPLQKVFPHNRLGVLGDSPKVNCATCHQGAFKPFYGASMLNDYPELRGPTVSTQTSMLEPVKP